MAHRLNTNKQFMIGNGILAFAVIFVVVLFVYMSMRLQREHEGGRYYAEHYTFSLVKGFEGDSVSIFLNDSLLLNKTIDRSPFDLEVKRFAEENALMIVNNATERISLFELSEREVPTLREGRRRSEATSAGVTPHPSYKEAEKAFSSCFKASLLPSVRRSSNAQNSAP